jgi:hypothetical protein
MVADSSRVNAALELRASLKKWLAQIPSFSKADNCVAKNRVSRHKSLATQSFATQCPAATKPCADALRRKFNRGNAMGLRR